MSLRSVFAAVLIALAAEHASPKGIAPVLHHRVETLGALRGIVVDYVAGDVAHDSALAKHLNALFSLPYVSGVDIYFSWADLQPSPGAYNWFVFDTLLKFAAVHGKHAAIGLRVASFAPQWVKDRVPTFTFTHPNAYVGTRTAPVPWNPLYVSYEKEMIAQLAKRYDGNPLLGYVEMSGPSTLFGVETNWPMQPGSISQADLAKLAFTPNKYVNAWKEMIQIYYDHFHKTQLGLALNNQFGIEDLFDDNTEHIARMIRRFAIAKYPRNGTPLAVRLLGLSAGDSSRLVNTACNSGHALSSYMALAHDVRYQVDVQFQMASVFRAIGYSPQQFARALQIGVSCGASVIEVKSPDVWINAANKAYEPYREALEQTQVALLRPIRTITKWRQ